MVKLISVIGKTSSLFLRYTFLIPSRKAFSMNRHRSFFAKLTVTMLVLYASFSPLIADGDADITGGAAFKYSSEINYPFFQNEPQLNNLLNKKVAHIAMQFQKEALAVEDDEAPYFHELKIIPSDIYHNEKVISFFLFSHEYTGGAHGMVYLIPFNYNKKTKKLMSLKEVFKSAGTLPENWLIKISDEARRQLLEELVQSSVLPDEDWIKEWIYRGTEPIEENFSAFTIEDDRIRIVFGPYQVAGFAAGMPEITLPLNFFQQI